MSDVEYRDILGFDGYRVGNDGSVWGCRVHPLNPYGEWRRLVPHCDEHGYWQVGLRRPRRNPKRHHIARLVLEAFVGPCPKGMEALHGLGGKGDNSVSNLRWGTRKENAADQFRDGTDPTGIRNPNVKVSPEIVEKIRMRVANGESQQAVADDIGIGQTQVSRIVRREAWKSVSEG